MIAQGEGLFVPPLRFFIDVPGVIYRAERVVDQQCGGFIPVFLHDGPGPLVPAFGLLVLEFVLGGQSQRLVVHHHLFLVLGALMDVQGLAKPLFSLGVATLVQANLAQAVVVIGHRIPVLSILDDGQGLLEPFLGPAHLPTLQGDGAELVVYGRGPRVGVSLGLRLQKIQ